jgi:HK97 family phage prohead protease
MNMADKMKNKIFRFKLDATGLTEAGHFTGYASIFGICDSYGDIVDKGSFKKTIKEKGKRFKLFWSHDAFAPAIGYVELEEDDKGLRVADGQLYLDIERAREAYINMKNGTLDGLSIGYNTVKETIDRATNERHLKEIALWEVSLCNFQACPGAVVTDVKGRFDKLRQDIESIEGAAVPAELRADLSKDIESLIALYGNAEPPAGTPEESHADEPPADSGADDLCVAKDWRDFLATLS